MIVAVLLVALILLQERSAGLSGLLGLAALLAFMKYIFHPLWLARRMPEGILAISLATALIILALFDHYLWSQWSGIALALLALGLGQKMIRPSP